MSKNIKKVRKKFKQIKIIEQISTKIVNCLIIIFEEVKSMIINCEIAGFQKKIKKIAKTGIILFILFLVYFGYSNAQDAQTHYQNGYQYFSQGDYQKAEENYKKAIELDPNFENAYYWLGKTYRQTGQYDKTIPIWIEVLKINPRNPYAFRYLNESFRDTSRAAGGDANKYVVEGLKILEVNENIFLNGNSMSNNSLLSAIPYFKKAIDLEDKTIDAHYWLGEIYQALSKKISWQYTSLAIASFEKVISTEESNNPFAFIRPPVYWQAYQELMGIFQPLGLNERKDNLLKQLQTAKAMPYEHVLNNAGYDNFGYPDSIDIIKENSKELMEIWKYDEENRAFRVVNKEVVGEEPLE